MPDIETHMRSTADQDGAAILDIAHNQIRFCNDPNFKTPFARADAWTGWAEGRQQDTPLRGLSHVLTVGARGIAGLFEHLYADLRSSMKSRPMDVKKLKTKD